MNENPPRAGSGRGAQPVASEAFDLDRLKLEIREGLARQRAGTDLLSDTVSGFAAELRAASLRRVEKHADIAAGVPDLPRFRGPLRMLARLLARCVLHISRFLTSRQRECNYAVLSSLTNLHEGLVRLEAAQQRQLHELRALRAEVQRLVEQRLAEPDRKVA
jgi:hypothetical protein